MSSTAKIAEWLEGHAGKQGVAGSILGGGILYHFDFFRVYPVDNSSVKTVRMKSSMAFIHGKGWTQIDLLLKQIWRWLI